MWIAGSSPGGVGTLGGGVGALGCMVASSSAGPEGGERGESVLTGEFCRELWVEWMDAAVPPVTGGALIVGEVVVAETVVVGDVGRAVTIWDEESGVGDRVAKGDVTKQRTPGAQAGDVGVADVVGRRARDTGAGDKAVDEEGLEGTDTEDPGVEAT